MQRDGTGIREMRRLLEAFSQHRDFEKLKDQAFKENLLSKTSDHHIKSLLAAFKRRFLTLNEYPPAQVVADAMVSKISETGKMQILLPYFIHSDPLVEEIYINLVLPRSKSSNSRLHRDEVLDYINRLSTNHPELKKWSEYLRLRWARGFLALLRHFNLMERHPSTKIKRLWIETECFAFFWMWFWQQKNSFWDAERHDLWKIMQLEEKSKTELLMEGQLRGWWIYQRSGEIVQFQPRFKSLEDWLQHGLA